MWYHHHHHHVPPPARISLTLSRHFSLSFIASGRSSRLHPVSSQSYYIYVRAGRPAFARSYVGVHRSTSLMSSPLLLQQCPACLFCLTWIVFVMVGKWSVNIIFNLHDSNVFFNWNHFEMRLLNLRINFFIYCGLLALILVVSVLFLLSLRFGQISPLAFIKWFTATSDRNAKSCNSNYCLPYLLSIAPCF